MGFWGTPFSDPDGILKTFADANHDQWIVCAPAIENRRPAASLGQV